MALLTRKSTCKICGELLGDRATRAIVAFGHFIGNRLDPLYPFTDAAVHADCLERDPRHDAALACQEALLRRECVCHACKQVIAGERIYTGFVVGLPNHPLWRYNFLSFHPEHFDGWADRSTFEQLLRAYEESDAYEGPPLRPRRI